MRYASTNEVVREALRLMAETDRRSGPSSEGLRAAWRDGVESGDVGEIDFATLKTEARARRAAKV